MDILQLEQKYKDNQPLEQQREIELKMTNAHSTGEDMGKLSENLSYFTSLAYKISTIQKLIASFNENSTLLQDSDEEIKSMVIEENQKLQEEIEQLDKDITMLKIDREFSDEDDSKSVIMEIRAGAGGDEASLFAGDLFEMYKIFATNKNWEVTTIESSLTQGGGYKEVVAHISGKNVYKYLKYESGVHRVQRIPVTESSGRIHTSTASVAILPEAKEIDVDIKPEDITIDVMRASGAGGQCVNKTDSAVRITHHDSGIIVSCQETKYQAQNKEKAMQALRAKLYDKRKAEEAAKRSDIRSSQIGTAMRAEKIRTYNFPQNRITDHRIKKSWHNLEGILNGDIEELLTDVKNEIQLLLLDE